MADFRFLASSSLTASDPASGGEGRALFVLVFEPPDALQHHTAAVYSGALDERELHREANQQEQ